MDEETRKLQELFTTMFASMTGPISDMTRSLMAAYADGLVDARKAMLAAGFPEWMIHDLLLGMIGATKETLRKSGEGMHKE